MTPRPADCQTPRIARKFVRDWLRDNDPKYDFFWTPKGALIFWKEPERYGVRNPISRKEVHYETRETFVLNVSELLAICYGWKKDATNQGKV